MCLEHRWCSECSSAAAPKHTTSKAVLLLLRPAHKRALSSSWKLSETTFLVGLQSCKSHSLQRKSFCSLVQKSCVWCHIQLCFTSLDLMARNTFITATAELIDKWHTYPPGHPVSSSTKTINNNALGLLFRIFSMVPFDCILAILTLGRLMLRTWLCICAVLLWKPKKLRKTRGIVLRVWVCVTQKATISGKVVTKGSDSLHTHTIYIRV